MDFLSEKEISEIKLGKFIVFLGDEFARDKLRLNNLIKVLSRAISADSRHHSFFHIAQLVDDQLGRDQLIAFIQSQKDSNLNIRPDILEKLVNFPAEVFFTINYDNFLSTFFSKRSKPVIHIYKDNSINDKFIEGKTHVVHLLGEVSHPESLVLTDEDYDDLLFHLPTLSSSLNSFLASRTIFFLGFNPGDELFHRIYRSLFRGIERHNRATYLITRSISPLDNERLKNMGISIIDSSAEEYILYIDNLFLDAKSRVEKSYVQAIKPSLPYKFLDYFTSEDESVFWGRSYETDVLKQLILANKIVILFGPSGVGKTSLLHAGVSKKIEQEGYDVYYVRVFDDPLTKIKKVLGKSEDASEWMPQIDLKGFVENFLPVDSRIVVFLDQFEEFFINLGHSYRTEFARQISECRNSRIDIRFIISIRSEYFYRLDELCLHLPDIYLHRLRLGRLDEVKAEQAILKPAELFGFTYQNELTDIILKDLSIGGFDPPQLQIICHTLYSNVITRKTKIELEDYIELGGMQGILSGYLDRVLDKIAEGLGPISRECSKSILSTMVTSEQTKSVISKDQILLDDRVSQLPGEMILEVAKQLLNMRIIRRIPDEPQELFELAHDYLAPKIWEWLDKESIDLKYLHNMLGQEVSNWRRFNVLMDEAKLRALDPYRDKINFTHDEIELVFRSSLDQNFEFLYWHTKIKEQKYKVNVDQILRDGFNSPDHLVRKSSIICVSITLDQDFVPMFIDALDDPYPQVRAAAIQALENFDSPCVFNSLVKNLEYEIFIENGSFIMGDNAGEADEQPEHEVFLDSFYVDKYPITNADYKLFLLDHPNYDPPSNWIHGDIPTGLESHPVVYISWLDADAYAKWAGKRLLTEAEWERIASWDNTKSQKNKFPWGNTPDIDKCNTSESKRRGTTPVDFFSPYGDSACGCVDLAGNVWEWTSDWFSKTYYPVSPKFNPKGLEKGDYKVIRGGAWNYGLDQARCTNRAIYAYPISVKLANVGFRLALTSTKKNVEYQ